MKTPDSSLPNKKSSEAPGSIRIDSPSFEEFNGADCQSFIENALSQWRENHQRLLEVIKSRNFPFFGMHGTSRTNLDNILIQKRGHFEMTTFYKKDGTEQFLYGLYHASSYSFSYTHTKGSQRKSENDSGGILVFDLEEEGRNITHEWEHLYPGTLISSLGFDSKTEGDFFESLRNKDNLLFRTDNTFDSEVFQRHFKGIIRIGDLEKYVTPLKVVDHTTIARTILRNRFLAQEILAKALELLKVAPRTG